MGGPLHPADEFGLSKWIWNRGVLKASLGEEHLARVCRENWPGKNGSKESFL